MLRDPNLESLAGIDRGPPRMLDADGIERPGVERLRKILSEQECGRSEEHEAAQLAATKGPHFQGSGEHVAGEHAAGRVHAAVLPSGGGAQVMINLVVRRG